MKYVVSLRLHALTLGSALLVGCSADIDQSSRSTGGRSGAATGGNAGASTGGATSGGATAGTGGASGSAGATTGVTSGGSAGQSGVGGGSSGQGGTGAGGQGGGGAAGSGGQGGAGTGGSGTGGSDGGRIDASPEAGWSDAGGSDASVGDSGFPPITECPKPSVDRLQVWTSSGPQEGTTIPPTGDLLVMEGAGFLNVEWHVCPVYLANQFSANANLSASSGFVLTYSSTSDMYVQARPTSHWNGGDQWATKIPSTGGVKVSQFFSFEPANWKSIFGTPTWTLADTLKEVLGFVFVGQTPNTITFYGLRFDGYVPPCR